MVALILYNFPFEPNTAKYRSPFGWTVMGRGVPTSSAKTEVVPTTFPFDESRSIRTISCP